MMNTKAMDARQALDGQAKVAVGIVLAASETIRQAREIPSGSLYAMLMGKINMSQYETILRILAGARLVAVENHLVRWVGPEVVA